MERDTHEVYCRLETSKLLEQAGFKWDTDDVYVTVNGKTVVFPFEATSWALICDECHVRPTLDVAQRWLREVKHIDVTVHTCVDDGVYGFDIDRPSQSYHADAFDDFGKTPYNNYEVAREDGIVFALNLILEGKL